MSPQRDHVVDRREVFADEDATSPQTIMRHRLDRLIAYLCRTSWHKRPQDMDVSRIESLLDDVYEAQDVLLQMKRDRDQRRAQERGFV